MPISSFTQRFMCTVFVFTMICGAWQYAAVENTFYFEDRETVVSEEICEYAVTQRIAEHKRSHYSTNTSGLEALLPLLSILLGFLLYESVVRKLHLCRLPNDFLPKLCDFHGMLPLPFAPPRLLP